MDLEEKRKKWATASRAWRAKHPTKANLASKTAKAKKPEVYAAIRYKSKLKTKYGLTRQEVEDMEQNQHSCCALCLLPLSEDKVVIDHCHVTGRVRGLLHNKCNALLGFASDSIERLQQAIKYLEK